MFFTESGSNYLQTLKLQATYVSTVLDMQEIYGNEQINGLVGNSTHGVLRLDKMEILKLLWINLAGMRAGVGE